MKRILKNRRGVTLLEGLIALGLLALVAAGTFGVLLSVAHKSSKPDIREEMVLAVEKANDMLQMYSKRMDNPTDAIGDTDNVLPGLCAPAAPDTTPLKEGIKHDINCLLPVICDTASSEFKYTVESGTFDFKNEDGGNENYIHNNNYTGGTITSPQRKITFNITCNGFVL